MTLLEKLLGAEPILMLIYLAFISSILHFWTLFHFVDRSPGFTLISATTVWCEQLSVHPCGPEEGP